MYITFTKFKSIFMTPKKFQQMRNLFSRSSSLEVFCKKGVPRNFAKFTWKHLRQSLFFNKVANLRPATLLKNRLWHRCFPVNFTKFLRTPFFTEHLRWLLLILDIRAMSIWSHLRSLNRILNKFDMRCLSNSHL